MQTKIIPQPNETVSENVPNPGVARKRLLLYVYPYLAPAIARSAYLLAKLEPVHVAVRV